MNEPWRNPPSLPLWILERCCRPWMFEEIAGDLHEQYARRYERFGRRRARLLFWKDAILFIRPYAFGPEFRGGWLKHALAMWKSYLKTALRSMRRQKIYAGVNVLGLTVGIACALLAALFVLEETSYDRFHEKGDRVVRFATDLTTPEGQVSRFSANAWPVGLRLEEDVPGIEDVVHLRGHSDQVLVGETLFFDRVYFAEQGFFDLFAFPFVSGDPNAALSQPRSAVVTVAAAERYFGSTDVLGQSIILRDSVLHEITGVVDIPGRRTHVRGDVFVSFSTWDTELRDSEYEERWFDLNMYHYGLLSEGADIEAVRERAQGIYDRHSGERLSSVGYSAVVRTDALRDVYARADRGNAFGVSGDMRYVYLIAGVGLLMILVAAINFVNLSTARSLERAREVGMRKVVGSSRAMIVQQFLGEAGLTGAIAMVLGIGLAALSLPFFNTLTQRELALSQLWTPTFAAIALGLGVVVTFAAGFYPALVMARHRPVDVLKGSGGRVLGGGKLRRTLVVVQYAISCVLILSALAGYRQIEHMRSADLGFSMDQVLVVNAERVGNQRLYDTRNVLFDRLQGQASVQHVTQTTAVPGRTGWPSIMVFPEGRSQDDGLTVEFIAVDDAFVETFDLRVIAGRDFDPDRAADDRRGLLINEAAVAALGFGSPTEAIGKRVQAPNRNADGWVVGVVADYHHHSLQQAVRPIIYGISPYARYVAMRAQTADMSSLLSNVEKVWRETHPGYGFDYFFLDEGYDQQYQTEARLTKVFLTFAVLSILISCLGLFGLSAFTISRRTREIGVRKVLGATSSGIIARVSREFVTLVGLAFIVAAPIGWLVLDRWLSGFAYRISVGPGLLGLTALLALSVALLTVGYHSIRASRVDPARALRYE